MQFTVQKKKTVGGDNLKFQKLFTMKFYTVTELFWMLVKQSITNLSVSGLKSKNWTGVCVWDRFQLCCGKNNLSAH